MTQRVPTKAGSVSTERQSNNRRKFTAILTRNITATNPPDCIAGVKSDNGTNRKRGLCMAFREYFPCGLEENGDYEVTYTYKTETGRLRCAAALVSNRFSDLTVSTEKMSFTSFDCSFDAPVEISIVPKTSRKFAEVRPRNCNIAFSFDGKELRVRMTKPEKISVEFDGDLYHNLFIFANTPAEKPDCANLITFEKGAYNIGELRLSSGQTLWIDGDATLFGHITAEGENIRILGRGVLCGAELNHDVDSDRPHLLCVRNSSFVNVEDIILTDSPAWTLVTDKSDHVTVKNLKQICHNANSDGFDICGTSHVLIEDCFIRNWDDSISLKSFGGDNIDIICRNTVMWADRAHNMLIGPEAQTGKHNRFKDILFENITVLEHREYSDVFQGVMAIFCADDAEFENITWRNIIIERMTYGRVFDFRYVTLFAETIGASCKNITVENVECYAPVLLRCRVLGADETHPMENVLIRNVKICGKSLAAGDPVLEINGYNNGVTVEA